MRGLCMLCVILGHFIPMNGLNVAILSFHMMAFFFISGLCFKKSDSSLWTRVRQKCLNMGWPLLTFSLLSIMINYIYLQRGKGMDVTLTQAVFGIFLNDGILGKSVALGFWFVQDLLYVSLIYIILEWLLGRIFTLLIWVTTVLILSFVPVEFFISNIMCRIAWGGLFYSLGSLWVLFSSSCRSKISRWSYLIIGLILFIATTIIAQFNIPVLLLLFQYGNIGLFVATGILGSLALWCVANYINQNTFLEFVGRNSIAYLFIHFYIRIFLLFLVDDKYNDDVIIILLFMANILLSTLFCLIINKYTPWVTKPPKLAK